LKHHPESVVALNNLAQVLADQNRNDEALKLIDEAVSLGGPFASAAMQTRSQILMKRPAPH
jgi:predicted negative regulator of RcsB-dependent stress response